MLWVRLFDLEQCLASVPYILLMKKLTALKTDSDPKIESILPLDPDPEIEWILANIEWM